MITDFTKQLVELIKLAPRYLIALGLAAGILLFSPDDFLQRLGVLDFTQKYRSWLGLFMILAGALLAVTVARASWDWVRQRLGRKAFHRNMMRRLSNLTEDEKQILRYYVAENTRANTLRMDDGVVQGLAADGIIFRSASMGNMLEGFAHNISDEAWDYLHRHPEVLVGETNTYRCDKRLSRW